MAHPKKAGFDQNGVFLLKSIGTRSRRYRFRAQRRFGTIYLKRYVGENYQLLIRLISNEIDRHAPFHYCNWQEVPGDVKMSILTTLYFSILTNHYFYLQQYHNTEYWDGIKLGIQADCANRYKDRKTKLMKHFDKEGGYDNTERAKQNPPKGMDRKHGCRLLMACLQLPHTRIDL
ncbi:hypothetical protein R6Q59_023399 [Mikania micrantha]